MRAHNHRLAMAAALRIVTAWDTALDGPPRLHGSMIAIRLPEALQRRDPRKLIAELLARYGIVAAINSIDGVLWARISAQVYNVPGDYERLGEAVLQLGDGCSMRWGK